MKDMTDQELRDWFAAYALMGLLANPALVNEVQEPIADADDAWHYADAMMKERERRLRTEEKDA